MFRHTIFLLILASLVSSCFEDTCESTRTFTEYVPVYIKSDELRTDLKIDSESPLTNTGKIYFYNDYIFINELYEGIHIIDNSDPTNPVQIAYYNIPGNIDIAIKDNYLYADSYVDLLTIDISNIMQASIVDRNEDIYNYYYPYHEGRGYVTHYLPTEKTIVIDCSDSRYEIGHFYGADGIGLFSSDKSGNSSGTNVSPNAITGTGGSLARFSITNNYLYIINEAKLYSYSLTEPKHPKLSSETFVDWSIETIFLYKEYLFLGAQAGLFIYDNSDPTAPSFISKFDHANACDPVYVKDDIAYVTLRNGTNCKNYINQLDVIDVADMKNPKLLHSFDMANPHGLSVYNEHLYICEGRYGLKVFDVSELSKIGERLEDHVKSIHTFDVIALSDSHILVIGEDGFYQYDTSNKKNLKLISHLPVTKS